MPNGDDPDNDWAQGYGYQFWRCRPANSWRGDGAFGQYMVGLPDQDVVVAITSGRQDMHEYLQVLWDRLLPGLSQGPIEARAHDELDAAITAMRLDPPTGEPSSPAAARISGRTITFDANPYGLRSAMVELGPSADRLTIDLGAHMLAGEVGQPGAPVLAVVDLGRGLPTLVRGAFRRRLPEDVLVSGTWTAPDAYVVTFRFVESPFVLTATATVQGDDVAVAASWNASFGLRDLPTFRGKATDR